MKIQVSLPSDVVDCCRSWIGACVCREAKPKEAFRGRFSCMLHQGSMETPCIGDPAGLACHGLLLDRAVFFFRSCFPFLFHPFFFGHSAINLLENPEALLRDFSAQRHLAYRALSLSQGMFPRSGHDVWGTESPWFEVAVTWLDRLFFRFSPP